MSDDLDDIRARHRAVLRQKEHERYADRNGAEAHNDRAALLRMLDEAAAREARLREALEYVLNVCPPIDPTGEDARRAARAALAAGAVKP